MFEIGAKVTVEELLSEGWYFESFDSMSGSVSYLSPDGKFHAVFTQDNDYAVVGYNK